MNFTQSKLFLAAFCKEEDPPIRLTEQVIEHEGKHYAILMAKMTSFPSRFETHARLPMICAVAGAPAAEGLTHEQAVCNLALKMMPIIIKNRLEYVEWAFKVFCGNYGASSDGCFMATTMPSIPPDAHLVASADAPIKMVGDLFTAHANNPQIKNMKIVVNNNKKEDQSGDHFVAVVMPSMVHGCGPLKFILGLYLPEITKLAADPKFPLAEGQSFMQAVDNLKNKMDWVAFDNAWIGYVQDKAKECLG